jgi:hypothetical protein
MTKIPFLLVLILLFSCTNPKQNAIIDPLQNNHNPTLAAISFIPELDNILIEISGLLVYNDLLWGINDSGGENVLYGFTQSGQLKRQVEIEGAINNDWEALAQDDEHIYIGDFGNNWGGRKNLCIYKIEKSQISADNQQRVKASKIKFRFSNQQNFGYPSQSTPFDCEALMVFNNFLYVFSKDWEKGTTVMYKIPKKPGDYVVQPAGNFNVDMLVTGADIDSKNQSLVLVGYNNYKSYLWMFEKFSQDSFFYGEANRVYLKNLDNAQTEGVTFYGADTVLVSTERSTSFRQQVFLLPINQLSNATHKGK